MTHLDLCLLGPPQICAGDTVLDFATRKTLALLVYLAVEGGMQPRETLAALLWPDSDGSRARANLRNTLNYLRNSLPADESGATPHLIIERDALAFDQNAPYTLDWERLTRATGGDDRSLLRWALDAYRGDFLQGFSPGGAPEFDNWTTLQRESAHRRMNTVCDRLSRILFEAGDWQAAQQTVERWLAHDKLQEAAYQRLMRIHLAQGDRAAALRAYGQCADVLASELDLDPAPATEALRARAPAGKSQPPPREGAGQQDAPRFADGPLVGREAQFSELVAAYHRAARHELQAVLIGGEPGIGKTRLASDFVAWAAAQGAEPLAGRSFETDRRLPYHPLVEALRPRLQRINAPEDLLGDVWLAALSRLLPEILDRYPDLAQQASLGEAGERRDRIFESLARLVAGLAARLPQKAALVLWLDDLQWADNATLDALRYCCRRWQGEDVRLLMLLGARSEDLHPRADGGDAALANYLADLEREIPLTRLELVALLGDDVDRFLRAFHVQHTPAFTAWLQDETGGQPFYLVETLRELAAQEALPRSGAAWQESAFDAEPLAAPAPRRVRRLLTSRMARLSAAAFDMLVASAVLAQDIRFDQLCTVAGLDEDAGLYALDDLLRGQLLLESGGAFARRQVTYVFAHDKIRDVAYAEAGAARRRVFHRRALSALREAGAAPARLAHHALLAGEHAAALRHSVAAGEHALSLFAAGEAIAHFRQARALLGDDVVPQESVQDELLQRLHLRLGRGYELHGDYDAALETYDALQTLACRRDDRRMELAALMARTTVYAAPTHHYDPQSVQLLTDRALPLARALQDHAAEAKIHWNLLLLKLFTGELTGAIEHGEQAREIARRHDLPEIEAYAWHDLTRAYLFIGRPREALETGAAAQERWRALDNQAMLADNLITTATLDALGGRYSQALSPLREAYALSKKIQNKWNQSYARHHLGLVHFELGHIQESIDASVEAIELGEQAGFMIPSITNGCILALLHAYVGDPAGGFPWIERALEAARRMHERQTSGPLAARAHLLLEQGDIRAAAEQIEMAMERLHMDELSMGVFLTLPTAADLALAQGTYRRAIKLCRQFNAYMQQRQLMPFMLDGQLKEARAQWGLGRRENAVVILQSCRAQAHEVGARRVLLPILLTLAHYGNAQSRADEARDARAEAASVAAHISAHIQDPTLRQTFQARLKPYNLPISKG